MKSEFDAAGIVWQPHPERVHRLAATIDDLERLRGEEQSGYDTLQRPRPPLVAIIVSMGEPRRLRAGLAMAAAGAVLVASVVASRGVRAYAADSSAGSVR